MAKSAASRYIDSTINLQTDEEVKDALARIKRRFSIVSTIRGFEAAGYDREFEIKYYVQIVRSRKATPETKRRALDALVKLRMVADEFEPDSKTGANDRSAGTKAERTRRERYGAEFAREAASFTG